MPEEIFKTDINGLVRLGPADRNLVDILTSNERSALVYVPNEYETNVSIGAYNHLKTSNFRGITQIEAGESFFVVHTENPVLLHFQNKNGKITRNVPYKGHDSEELRKLIEATQHTRPRETDFYFFKGTAGQMVERLIASGYAMID